MATKADVIRQVEQGERVKQVRESLRLKGDSFGEQLQRLAAEVGIQATYGKDKISRIESGRQAATSEELILISRLDPERRGVEWLAFGVVQGHGRPIRPGPDGDAKVPTRRKAAGDR